MKVIHACYLPLSSDHPEFGKIWSHPGRWVLNLALAQKKHTRIEPALIVQVPGSNGDFSTSVEGIPVHYIAAPRRFRSATFFFFDVQKICRRIRTLRPDFVHGHGLEDAYGLSAQKSGFPYVITAQGLHFLINRHVRPPMISRERIVEFTERYCLNKAHHVIAKSDYVAVRLKEKFLHLTIHRIPNTVDPRLFEINEEKDWDVVSFVGTIIRRKGLDSLCAALEKVRAEIPDVKLWVFGDDPETRSLYEKEIKERLYSLLGNNVVFHGAIPSLEVARRVAKACVLVAPSREEMFGNQLIEALSVGTHAIVTEGTAMAENVRRFSAGTVVPQGNSSALAREIIQALQTKRTPFDIAEVRKRILEYMGPDVVARQHEALYEQIFNSAKAF
jgi:glycosyltransferase involved in cell wall biosynthesis